MGNWERSESEVSAHIHMAGRATGCILRMSLAFAIVREGIKLQW